MGNSLLDIMVYGRIAGKAAGTYALGDAQDGKLHLDHVRKYNAEIKGLDVHPSRIAPLLLPDYTLQHVKDKQLTTSYKGSLR